ncbi:MAG: rod shape-determining protein MreD, partial [Deltaproteobacteria bacterium]|nr:rod shape-determining protein MreD [Deltaproteobacteria bacterium]
MNFKNITLLLVFLIIISVALALQTTLLYALFGKYKPHLLLIIIVYLAIHRPIFEGGLLALYCGYLLEFYSGSPQGLFMFSSIVTFFLIKIISQAFYIPGRLIDVLLVLLGSLCFSITALSCFFIFSQASVDYTTFLSRNFVSALLNGA